MAGVHSGGQYLSLKSCILTGISSTNCHMFLCLLQHRRMFTDWPLFSGHSIQATAHLLLFSHSQMVSEFIYEPMCTLWLSAFTHTPLQLRLLSHQFSRSSSFCSSLVSSPLPPFLQSISKTHNNGVWAACEWGLLRWSNSEMVSNGFAAESGCNIAARFDWAVIDPEEGSIRWKYLWSISLSVYPSFAFS